MVWTDPHILLGLWLLPLVAGLLVYAQRKRAAVARQFAEAGMVGRLMPAEAGWRPWVKGGLFLLGLACLIVAGARPRFGLYVEKVSRQGADLIVLLDVSRSMTAEDVLPNRLQRAKMDIGNLLDRLVGDRVGLVVFAGKPVLKVPLTTDQGFFRMVLDEVGPHSAPRGGTLIGDGVRKCLDLLPDQRNRDQAIVLITDGDDQQSYAEEAAQKAAERGVKIFTVGLGDAREGARIPVRDESKDQSVQYLEYEGQEVRSKLDEGLLQKIALTTGGAYIPAGTRVYDLGQIYTDHLAKLTRGQIHAEKRKRYREQFQLFVGLGLGLLLIEMWIARYPRPSTRDQAPEGEHHLAGGLARRDLASLSLLLLLLTLATPAMADPGVVDKVREGVILYQKGNYSGAATAFRAAETTRPDDLRITFDRACALAASGDVDKAVDLFQKAAVSRDPVIAVESRYNLGNLAAAKAQAMFGKTPQEATSEVRKEGTSLLLEAVGHYRDCLELAPEHANARHNLELIRLWIKHMEALWQERDRQKQQEETSLLDFLLRLDGRQRDLREESKLLATEPDSPKRRQALTTLETSQRELAEEIEPLKKKLAEAIQSSGASNQDNLALDHFAGLADQTHIAMTAAADRLKAAKPAEAVQSQAEAVEKLDQIYLGLVPFTQLLQRALKDEQALADRVDEVAKDEELQTSFDYATSAWEQRFFAQWSETLPAKAQQEMQQLEAAPASTPGDEKTSEEAKRQCECVKQALKKAIEFGSEKLRKPAAEAAKLLADKKPAEAVVQQNESLKLLKEIADLLPKQNQPKQNQQNDNEGSKQDEKQQEQNQKQQDQKPKDQKKSSDQDQKSEQPKKQDPSKQQAEAALRKVRERQQYRRDMERHLQQYLVRPKAVEKDW